jgi:hypothetical protein
LHPEQPQKRLAVGLANVVAGQTARWSNR